MASNHQYINVAGVLKLLDTGDRPIKIIAEDDKVYLIKHNISGYLQSNLIREWICYQIFKKLEVSIPKADLLYFEPMSFMNELKVLTGRFSDQIVFGSEWLEARDLKDELYEANIKSEQKLTNPTELAEILVMDLWLKNNDRTHNNLNLIVSNRKLYAIDHSATFDQDPFVRLANSVRKGYFVEPGEVGDLLVNSNYFKYYFNKYAGEFEESGLDLCNKIVQLDSALLEQIVESVPSEWNLTEKEGRAIIDYLIFRKNKLKDRFLGHLNFGRQ